MNNNYNDMELAGLNYEASESESSLQLELAMTEYSEIAMFPN